MSCDLVQFSVVVVGRVHNPSLLNPDFLAKTPLTWSVHTNMTTPRTTTRSTTSFDPPNLAREDLIVAEPMVAQYSYQPGGLVPAVSLPTESRLAAIVAADAAWLGHPVAWTELAADWLGSMINARSLNPLTASMLSREWEHEDFQAVLRSWLSGTVKTAARLDEEIEMNVGMVPKDIVGVRVVVVAENKAEPNPILDM